MMFLSIFWMRGGMFLSCNCSVRDFFRSAGLFGVFCSVVCFALFEKLDDLRGRVLLIDQLLDSWSRLCRGCSSLVFLLSMLIVGCSGGVCSISSRVGFSLNFFWIRCSRFSVGSSRMSIERIICGASTCCC